MAIVSAVVATVLLLAPLAAAQASCWRTLSHSDFPNCQDLSPIYALHWAVANGSITLGVEAAAGDGWVGLGLSDTGSMKGADITAIVKDPNGTWQATDMHAIGFQRPLRDAHQDTVLLSAESANGTTVAVFRRALVTCDAAEDLVIESGMPQVVIWAIGQGPELAYHGSSRRGQAEVNFQPLPSDAAASTTTNATTSSSTAAADGVKASAVVEPVRTLNITYANQSVPANETTYMCKYLQFPSDAKYHVTSYEGIITSKFMHHMVLYRCPAPPVNVSADIAAGQPFDCTESGSPCMEYAMVWAPGTPRTVMPPEAGLPFGDEATSWFVLNAHYNNPDGIEGGTDSSGFTIDYTTALRPHDMGVLTLGTTNLRIPPGRANFSAPSSLCPSACTSRFPGPLNLWNNYLHMHQIGDAMETKLIRPANASNGTTATAGLAQELQPTGIIRSYSFDFQKGTPVPPASRILLPGDNLVTTCRYDSRSRTNVTRMGLGSRDEMCYNFLFYYPRLANISACLSHTNFTVCGNEADEFSIDPDSPASLQAAVDSGLLLHNPTKPLRYRPYRGPACSAVPPVLPVGTAVPQINLAAASASVALGNTSSSSSSSSSGGEGGGDDSGSAIAGSSTSSRQGGASVNSSGPAGSGAAGGGDGSSGNSSSDGGGIVSALAAADGAPGASSSPATGAPSTGMNGAPASDSTTGSSSGQATGNSTDSDTSGSAAGNSTSVPAGALPAGAAPRAATSGSAAGSVGGVSVAGVTLALALAVAAG